MKKIPVGLAIPCLAAVLAGCATQDVQTGYLTPQQMASDSTSSSSISPGDTNATVTASSDRLPPPPATQNLSDGEDDQKPTQPTLEQPTVTDEDFESDSGEAIKTASAGSRTSQTLGGKSGQQPHSVSKSQPRADKDEAPRTIAERDEHEDQDRDEDQDEDKDEDRDEDEAKPQVTSRPVSSRLSPGETRVLDPQGAVQGVVVRINEKGNFVVMKFQYRAVPSIGKVLSVKRNGEKVGSIRVTRPVKSPHATGDILEGDVRRGDTVE